MQKKSQFPASKSCHGPCLTEDLVAAGKSLLPSFTKASEFLGTNTLLWPNWYQGQPGHAWEYPLGARSGHVCGNETISLGAGTNASFVLEAAA